MEKLCSRVPLKFFFHKQNNFRLLQQFAALCCWYLVGKTIENPCVLQSQKAAKTTKHLPHNVLRKAEGSKILESLSARICPAINSQSETRHGCY